jgi:hypothetical protein
MELSNAVTPNGRTRMAERFGALFSVRGRLVHESDAAVEAVEERFAA